MQILFKSSFLKRPFLIRLYTILFAEKTLRFVFGLVGIFCALFFLPTYHYIKTQATIVPSRIQYVRSPIAGVIESIYTSNGEKVYPDQPLLKLGNPAVLQEYQIALADFELAKIEFTKASESLDWEEHTNAPTALKAFESAGAKLLIAENFIDKLTLKSNMEGVVISNFLHRLLGQYVTPEVQLLEIADLSHFKLLIPLDNKEVGLVGLNDKIRVTFISTGQGCSSQITLTPQKKISITEMKPSYLRIFGGINPIPQSLFQKEIAPENDSSFYPLYIAEAPIPISSSYLHENMRAQVLIQGKRTFLGVQWWTNIGRLIGL